MNPTTETSEHGNVVKRTRYLLSEYQINYNADMVLHCTYNEIVDGPSKGAHQLVIEDNTILVPYAATIAKNEGRIHLSLAGVLTQGIATVTADA